MIPLKTETKFKMIFIGWSTGLKTTMKFNRNKYKVLRLRKRNQMHSYKMGNTWLSKATSEKDLGSIVDHKLDMSQQYDVATNWNKFRGG